MTKEVIIEVSDKDFATYYANDPSKTELVRCEKCIYYMPQHEHTGQCTWFSDVLKYGVGYNDYCSNAEKDGEQE